MPYVLLLLCLPVLNCGQSVAQKRYHARTESPDVVLFAAMTTLCALAFFLVSSGLRLTFDRRILPYALAFGVSYASAWVGTVLALRYGSLALTSLIVSFSLVFPTVYGLVTGEALRALTVAGLALLCAALVLINGRSGRGERISPKWALCVGVAFLGNGICAVASAMQKRALGDGYSHEFMILALSAAFVLLVLAALAGRNRSKPDVRSALVCSAANGVCNGLMNLIILTLIGRLPNTVLYPTQSALNMLATFLLAFFGYGERFSRRQYVGYALGALCVVLLNL